MNCKLVIVEGPLDGQSFDLKTSAQPFAIGRHDDNDLRIPDMAVSRRHCSIQQDPLGWVLKDLESRQGTLVNGARVREQRLKHGDTVAVGDTRLLFLLEETSVDDPDEQGMERVLLSETTIRIPVDEALRRQYAMELEGEPRTAARARSWKALVELGNVVHSIRETDRLADALLEHVLDAIPAQRAAALLLDPHTLEFTLGWAREAQGPIDLFKVSRTITDTTLREKTSLLCNDVLGEHSTSKSLFGAQVRAFLCAPLIAFGRPLGILYLDTRRALERFDEDQLQFLTAVAGIAAVALDNVRHLEWLAEENRRLRALETDHGMLGEHARMHRIYEFISRVAPTDSTVLIRGESGTGKDLAASAIHSQSPRADKPFLAVNCAVLSETLIESELFGHEKGAFTGAVARKIGKLEVADGGTVFLDEIGELPPGLQAKLLRVLETKRFERVGGTQPVEVDVRFVAATNRDLEKAIEKGEFREDLFYRLNVLSFEMPALRERRSDVPLLAAYFSARFAKQLKRPPLEIPSATRAALLSYDWPGNVRELSNAIERAVVLAASSEIRPEDLPESLLETSTALDPSTQYHDKINEVKRRLVVEALDVCQGNVTHAAKRLGLHPNYLHRLIRNLGLKSEAR